MSTASFSTEQWRFFRAQCLAMNDFCTECGLQPLVTMSRREIFSIYCDGNLNLNPAMHRRPINDN